MIIFDNFSTNYWLVFLSYLMYIDPFGLNMAYLWPFSDAQKGSPTGYSKRITLRGPTCQGLLGLVLKRGLFKDIKNDISMNQTNKYKNTNTQIHYMIKYQKDPTCCIFLKRGLFKDIKNDIPMSQIGEYKNTNLRLTNAKKTQHVVYFWREDCSWIFSESRMVVQGLVQFGHCLNLGGGLPLPEFFYTLFLAPQVL